MAFSFWEREDRNIKSVLWKPTPWNGIPFFIDACNHLGVACALPPAPPLLPRRFLSIVLYFYSVAFASEAQAALAFVFWPGNDFSPLLIVGKWAPFNVSISPKRERWCSTSLANWNVNDPSITPTSRKTSRGSRHFSFGLDPLFRVGFNQEIKGEVFCFSSLVSWYYYAS